MSENPLPTYSRKQDNRKNLSILTKDQAFNRHSFGLTEHTSPFDNNNVLIGTDGIKVRLVQDFRDEDFKTLMSRTTRATMGLSITDVPESDPEDWEEMLKGGLQTALEAISIAFEATGVSRTATHQIVRQRKAAFHQQSQRAVYMGEHPEIKMPESIWRNLRARDAFMVAKRAAEKAYNVAVEEDISYQDARFALLEGTTTYILCEMSLREFLNVYAFRACSMMQWEICAMYRMAGQLLVLSHPWLEPYVNITCEKTGVCEFQGWENVELGCDFPQARQDNRRFKPEFHAIEPKPKAKPAKG